MLDRWRMGILAACLVFCGVASAQCVDAPIVSPNQGIEVQISPVAQGDRLNVWFDPVSLDGSDDHCWQNFHLFVNGEWYGQYDWEYHHSIDYQQALASRADNPFGTADSAWIWFYPEEEGPVEVEIRYGLSALESSAYPNPFGPVTAQVDRVVWDVDFGDAMIPSDGSPILVPVTITPDEAAKIKGWNFALLWDHDRIEIDVVLSQTWADNLNPNPLLNFPVTEPPPEDYITLVGSQLPSWYAEFMHNEDGIASGEFFEGGFGWTTTVIEFFGNLGIDLAAGQPIEAFFLLVSAKPGAAPGPVDFQVVSWDDTMPTPSYVNTKISVIAYARASTPTQIQEFPPSPGWWMEYGGFELMAPGFVQPVWEIADALPFMAGDMDASGTVGLPDAIGMLMYLFSGSSVVCEKAVDVNMDGEKTLTDPVFVLQYAFASGPSPYGGCMVSPVEECVVDQCP